MTAHPIHTTEQRLVTLFVGGAFLFLLIFECFFIVSRSIFENRYQRNEFEGVVMRMMDMPEGSRRGPRANKPSMGIGFITIDGTGNILESQLGPTNETDLASLVDKNVLIQLPAKRTILHNGILLRKAGSPSNENQKVFIGKAGYLLEDIWRDILRFLIMDILILLPFWFMGKYFVRETLKPVYRNLDAMSHFIHDAGHELKTPLAIISGNLQLLRDNKVMDKDLIKTSLSSIHSMSESLTGLLELSNIKVDKKDNINLKNQIDEILKEYESAIQKNGITVIVDIPEKLHALINRKHFQILFSNLLKNAIRYNREGGSIRVLGKANTISITDTGIGIDEKNLIKIFDRFYREDRGGKYAGTGIGLAIVDNIVKMYGWTISVESRRQYGSTFTIHMK